MCSALFLLISADDARAQQNDQTSYSWQHLPTAQLPVFKKDTFNIVKYGAIADAGSINTKSIAKAIDDCSEHGGGTVLIPKGKWITGPFKLKNNVNLHLAKGSIIEFTKDKNLYPLVSGSFEGLEAIRNQSPISGDDLENIAITGFGVIDGNGEVWRSLSKAKAPDEVWSKTVSSGGVLSDDGKTWYPSAQSKRGNDMYKSNDIKKLKTMDDFAAIKDYLRPNLIVLNNCKKIFLEGVTFQNSAAWCLHPLMCSELTITRITVNNPEWAQNGDGIDIESCRNVVLEHSSFECGDDGICIKSGKDEQGRKRGMPTENITIHDDTVHHAHGGFVIGSEMSGGAKNIFVYNCYFYGTDKGLRFKTVRGRGGMVSNIYAKDIHMKDIVDEAIYFDMYYFTKPPKPGEKPVIPPVGDGTPRFQDFYISNIVCDGAETGIFVRGLPEMNIKNINLQNITLKAKTGVQLIEADNIRLDNIHIDAGQTNPVVFIENSANIDFNKLYVNPNSTLLFNIAGDRSKNINASGINAPGIGSTVKFTNHADKSIFKVL